MSRSSRYRAAFFITLSVLILDVSSDFFKATSILTADNARGKLIDDAPDVLPRHTRSTANDTELAVPENIPDERQPRRHITSGAGSLLWMITSYDRGQRIRGMSFSGDKLSFVLRLLDEARLACEFGYDVTVAFLSAWDIIGGDGDPDIAAGIVNRTKCNRTGRQMPLISRVFSPGVGGALAWKHRVLINDLWDEEPKFDMYASMEDDMYLTFHQIHRYKVHIEALRSRHLEGWLYPGFIRYETVTEPPPADFDPLSAALHDAFPWEPMRSPGRLRVADLGDGLGHYVIFTGKYVGLSHQACWVADREQVAWFNATCPLNKEGHGARTKGYFLAPKSSSSHVEYWTGALQLFQDCGLSKAIPLDEFPLFLVHHMSNNKVKMPGRNNNQFDTNTRQLLDFVMRKPVTRNLTELKNLCSQ